MKLACDARALLGALDLCLRVTPAKTTLPVLHQVGLCAAADNTLSATATDLTMQVRSTMPARVAAPGSALVPARVCAQWLTAVETLGAPVELELGEDGRVQWWCGPHCMRTLHTTDELPVLLHADQPECLPRITAAALRAVLPALMAVAHDRDARVHVNVEATTVALYAFGRDQAVLAPLPSDEDTIEGDWCIPARGLSLLTGAEGVLLISVDHRLMRWSAPNVEVSVLLDRTAPPAPTIMDLVAERLPDDSDDFSVGRRDLLRLFGAGTLLKTPARLAYEADGQHLMVRGARDDRDDTFAAVDVVEAPEHEAAVVVDCEMLERMARELPGDPLGINIYVDVLGGPGVLLWPYEDLADGALLLYGLRGAA
jgi:hypothetical protein